MRLHQIELRVGNLQFLADHIDLGHTSDLEEGLDLLQMLTLILQSGLSHLDQLLRGQNAEIRVAHIEQDFLADPVAVLLRLGQFRLSALHRATGQTEVINILAEIQSGVVVRRIGPSLAIEQAGGDSRRDSGTGSIVIGLLVVRGAEVEMRKIR